LGTNSNIIKWKRTKETLEPLDDGKIGGSLREDFIEQRIRYWADYSRIPSCSTCGQHMAFFALFIPDCPDDFIMLVFVFQCEAHDELTTVFKPNRKDVWSEFPYIK